MSRINVARTQDALPEAPGARDSQEPTPPPQMNKLSQRFEEMLGADRAPRGSHALTIEGDLASLSPRPARVVLPPEPNGNGMASVLAEHPLPPTGDGRADPQPHAFSNPHASPEPKDGAHTQVRHDGGEHLSTPPTRAGSHESAHRPEHEDSRQSALDGHQQARSNTHAKKVSTSAAKQAAQAAQAAVARKQRSKVEAEHPSHEDATQPVLQAPAGNSGVPSMRAVSAESSAGPRASRTVRTEMSAPDTSPLGRLPVDDLPMEDLPLRSVDPQAMPDGAGMPAVQAANGDAARAPGMDFDPDHPARIQVVQQLHQETAAAAQMAVEVVQEQRLVQANTPESLPLHLLDSI